MKKISKTVLAFLIFGYAFLYVPIVLLMVNSFSASEIPGIWTTFSFKWFYKVLEDEDILYAAITSLEIASISATGAVCLGILSATATKNPGKFRGKKFLDSVIIMPVVMPEIILGFSLLMLFMAAESLLGLPKERGLMTVAIGHIMASVAYVHMTVRTRMMSLDSSLEEAALSLGAKPFTVFTQIKVPIIAKSILAGWLLAFTLSLDDLVIASFLSGPGSTTLPILIFSNVRIGVTPMINAFATIFIVLIALCIFLAFLITSKKKNSQKEQVTNQN
ncbi:MAG: ABC transporter permease subunit [Holosporales bacterium]|jgi:putrescine transport system permease protein|nr:ABC transporter permease subunit [Holosporales bacterium]